MTAVGSIVDDEEVGRTVSAEIARDWETWSRTLGILALPHLQRIQENVPTLTAAMLCTGDGLNIAAIGIPEAGIGRLAALSSSLFGVAGAHRELIDPAPGGDDSTMVSVAGGRTETVVLRFQVSVVGPLLLVVAAEDVNLGILVVAARSAAQSIRSSLEPQR